MGRLVPPVSRFAYDAGLLRSLQNDRSGRFASRSRPPGVRIPNQLYTKSIYINVDAFLIGVPMGIRTQDLRLRRPLLYPAELNPVFSRVIEIFQLS